MQMMAFQLSHKILCFPLRDVTGFHPHFFFLQQFGPPFLDSPTLTDSMNKFFNDFLVRVTQTEGCFNDEPVLQGCFRLPIISWVFEISMDMISREFLYDDQQSASRGINMGCPYCRVLSIMISISKAHLLNICRPIEACSQIQISHRF